MSDSRAYIFAPDLVAAATIDPLARVVLDRWRDGQFKAVFNRELLVRHLKVLQALGLGPTLLRRWTYWFTSPQKTIFLATPEIGRSATQICEALAVRQHAPILCWKKPVELNSPTEWKMVREFLEK